MIKAAIKGLNSDQIFNDLAGFNMLLPLESNKKVETLVSIDSAITAHIAKVVVVGDDCISIIINDVLFNANKAFSCLVEPLAGDTVALFQDEKNIIWITAILKRIDPESMTINLAVNSKLVCPDNLTILSYDKLNVVAEEINVLSQKHVSKSDEMTLDFSSAVVKGKTLASHISKINQVSDFISVFSNSMMQKFLTYVRKSEHTDQVQAAHMNRKIDGLYSMNSKHTIMVSEKETKIDGEHIHMG